MATNTIQASFAGGEFAPGLYGRVDVAKFHTATALMRNWFVRYEGGASTRPGTAMVCRALSSGSDYDPDTGTVVIIPFQFSVIQNYILEFGNEYMRVIKDGAPVLETAVALANISNSAIGSTTTAVAHGFTDGDWIFFEDVGGMTEMNGVTAVVTNSSTTTFDLLKLDGTNLSTTSFGMYTSGGTVSRIYTLATPYAASDLPLLKFVQSADVMTLTHPDYAPRELTRSGHANWTLTPITFGATIDPPTSPAAVASTSGTAVYAYVVTSIAAGDSAHVGGEESVASARADLNTAVNITTTGGFITVSWTPDAAAASYRVYRAPILPTAGTIPAGSPFGFIGRTTGTSFVDNNIVADFTITPPLNTNPLTGGNNPGAVGFFQQREVFGGSTSKPQTMNMSQPGLFHNFDVSDPSKDDDAIEVTFASRQVNNIKFMIPMPGGLVVFTGGGAFQVSGGTPTAAVTPTSISQTPQSYVGCSDIEPLTINWEILFVQSLGARVRDLTYDFYANIYKGTDISVFSSHFFQGYEIVRWTYADEPFKSIWAVRSDGRLLACTYLKEQEINGWSQHSTLGLFESIASIPKDNENKVYFVVRRLIGGKWVQFIEEMASRTFPYGSEDAWCVDCALTNDLTYPAAEVSASSVTGTVTFTATAAVFLSGNVGDVLRMAGGIADITGFTSTTVLTGRWRRDPTDFLPESDDELIPAVEGQWSLTTPFTTITGLDYLEGQTVQILGDGNVFPNQVVENGAVTLDHAVSKAIVGLGYDCDLQTLNLDTGEPTIQGKRKKLAAMVTRVQDTRGLKVGPTFSTLTELKLAQPQMGVATELYTGDKYQTLDTLWGEEGRMCLRQSYPLPATVLAVVPSILIGDTDR